MKAAKLARAVAVGAAFVGVAAAAWGCGGSATASGGGTPTAPAAETEPAPPAGPKIRYVAVVETEVDAQSGASAELNPAEVRQITAALRREAVENLPRGTYNIMTTETVQSMGGAVLEECSDENCVVTLGSKIGADYIVRGIISKFENKFTISVEMYETDNGMLVASSEYVRADSKAELMDKAVAASANMYRKFVNPAGVAPKQEQQQVAAPVAPTQQPAVAAPMPQPAPTQAVNQEAAPTVDASGTITNNRDGKKYRTVVIGGKRWMAENLNVNRGNSWCYDNNNSSCNKYGRLYDWNTARSVCPSGWHLPSRLEWDNLLTAAGGNKAGYNLKTRSGWKNNGNGTDSYGFSALPGGYRLTAGSFNNAGNYGRWWTATESSDGYAYGRFMNYYYDDVLNGLYNKEDGLAVRCVAD